MNGFLDHPWVKVLVIATTIAMCSFALRETASITQPIISALGEVLVPVAVAFAIAYVVTPVVDLLGRLGLKRTVAAGLLFGVGSLLVVLSLTVLIPALVRQSIDFSTQVFRGETYVDRNHNGHYDPGEPFDDLNRNGVRDPAMLSRLASLLEENQNRLKVSIGLGIGEPSLAFLSCYEQDTHDLRTWLDAMLAAARQGRPAGEWPAPPPLPASATAAWSSSWPGPLASDLDDAEQYLSSADRDAWRRLMVRGGSEFFQRHNAWLAALRRAQEGAPAAHDPLVARIQTAWQEHLKPEERGRVSAFALQLEQRAKSGQTSAHDLLTTVGVGAGSMLGGEAVSGLVSRLEDSIRGWFDDLPDRLGSWMKTWINGFEAAASLLIGVILIPIYSFFLLLGMPQIRTFTKDYLPGQQKDQIIRITREIEKVVAAFFRGRLLICVLCSVVGCIGFAVLGLFGIYVPYGMLWGISIGMATAIPLAGLVFIVPAALLALVQPNAGIGSLLAVGGVYLLIQGVEAALIPLIMGREVELHPVTLIVALLLCGKLLGVLGLILAVPIAATARILLREYFWPRLKKWAECGTW